MTGRILYFTARRSGSDLLIAHSNLNCQIGDLVQTQAQNRAHFGLIE